MRSGLTEAEVRERVAAGRTNRAPESTSRSLVEIVRANVFTRFNAILGTLLAVILVVGPINDALFGLVLVSNTAIGIIQEVRAKRTLDRLAVLNAPRATVIRDAEQRDVAVEELVADDVVVLAPGDQVVVDGDVLDATGLEVDESLLTGESDPVVKQPGDPVMSGSFVVAGSGSARATNVGADAYARRLAEEARRFSLVRSELRAGIDHILRLVTYVIVPVAALLVGSQLAVHDDNLAEAFRGSVAGVGSMIPEGLVLLTSVAFAVGSIRLGRRNVLVQELAALEGLARVDILCIDKTGTLTEAELEVGDVEVLGEGEVLGEVEPGPIPAALAAMASASGANATLRALSTAYPDGPDWPVKDAVAFSSARKWSASDFGPHGAWVLGAPDVLLSDVPESATRVHVDEIAASGRRVLLLARSPAGLDGERLAPGLQPAALVVLDERIRPDAAETLAYFGDQGVSVKVISGDHPQTAAAVAARVGLPGASEPVDARTLPEEPAALAEVVEAHAVFGRVTPHQKRAMVGALQARGHVVAMTGDGVNDVLALKDADLGVAMGSGSAASRAVARIVLLDNAFAQLPSVVAEGRRVIANVERVANLFVTKTVYAVLLALAVGVAQLPFPFFPRHLTIVSSLTIGIPAFFLALAPNAARAQPGFVQRVLRFAGPAGFVAAAATFAAYALGREEPDVSVDESRTLATLVLFGVGLWVLDILARPLTPPRAALVYSMAGAFVVALALPWTRDFFALEVPPAIVLFSGIGMVAVAVLALESGLKAAGWVALRRSSRARR